MLVLSRKLGESIVVNGNIEITIMEVKGEQIRIGIQAPQEIKVYRKEIYTEILNENQMASKTPKMQQLNTILKNMK